MIVIRILDYKAPNIWWVCCKQPVQMQGVPAGSIFKLRPVVPWTGEIVTTVLLLGGSQIYSTLPKSVEVKKASILGKSFSFFHPPGWWSNRKNPPLGLPYDWGRIGSQQFLCATRTWSRMQGTNPKGGFWWQSLGLLMVIIRCYINKQVQGAVKSMNCNSLTRVWAETL